VGLGGAHGPKVLKHVAELFTNSLNIVTLFKSAKDGLEITVLNSGEVKINGWATDSQLENLLEKL
jgi:hypothetical protein